MEISHHGYRLLLPDSSSAMHQDDVRVGQALLKAYAKYVERNQERKGVWRRSGLRGQCQNLFAKGERAFRQAMAGEVPNEDNFIDAIVYACFALVLMKEAHSDGLRDIDTDDLLNGDWPWEG